MEHRITITTHGHGHDPDAGERWLEGFVATHPEVGRVVAQNIETDVLSITFTIDAPDWTRTASS